MKDNKSKVGFVLQKIITEQFAILEEAHEDGKEAKVNTQIQFAINADQKFLGTKVAFKFENSITPFLVVEASCHFQIMEESWDSFRQENAEVYKVPAGFLCHLAMLTVGTVRGILHAKTENTPFNQYVVPTINVAALIKEDIVFDLKNQPAQ
jgi:hypothetical protein